jgi:hypothetical protein
MMKISRNTVIGGVVGLIGILVCWSYFRAENTSVGKKDRSAEHMPLTEEIKRRSRNNTTRTDHPEEWKWSGQRVYSTLGDGGRIGRDTLEIAGLQPDDGPRVKAVFDRAFQKVEEALASKIRKTETLSEGTKVTDVYEIKGDPALRNEVMKSLREDLIANFGNGAAKILYEGFDPVSKYCGMGGRDAMIKKNSMVVPTEEGPSGSFSGDLYGKKAGDRVSSFELKGRDSETGEFNSSSSSDDRYFRAQYGNLVSHFGLSN